MKSLSFVLSVIYCARIISAQEDAFTILFVSDMENRYRGHPPTRCRYVLEYLSDLKSENLFFDYEYSDQPIDPQLIIHGGDNHHLLGCENSPFCRTVEKEWKEVWKTSFDWGVPLITGFGNHDWENRRGTGNTSLDQWGDGEDEPDLTTDFVNRAAQRLVSRTYEETLQSTSDFSYQEFPAEGEIGPSFYRSVFRGVQIVSFNCAVNWESYDEEGVYSTDRQFDELAASLNRSMTTIFFQHYPIAYLPEPFHTKTIDLIQEIERSGVHLSGHVHRALQFDYDGGGASSFTDYIAPYPHSWPTDCSSCRDPGFYSLLVSPTEGVLQVKQTNIPGLQDGEACDPHGSCRQCHSGWTLWYSVNEWRCGEEEDFRSGETCGAFFICKRCGDLGHSCPWWGFFLFGCRCN